MIIKGGGDYLGWLARQQSRDGGFDGQASSTMRPFQAVRQHPTIFFTSLILACLEDVEGSEKIAQQAVRFLQHQQSPLVSWNYWQRGSALAASHPYPDDLDDTACALLGLTAHDPRLVDGTVLAHLATLLITNEVATGGPYRTWLVEPVLQSKWGDVDIAVNANIGGLLARHDVRLAGLEAYIDERLASNQLGSPYYVGNTPIVYFLARWYRGPQQAKLRRLVTVGLRQSTTAHSLELALLLSAGCNLKLPVTLLRNARQRLLALAETDHWPAEALYVDPVIGGVQYYAGSAALTTAFALEALAKFSQYDKLQPLKDSFIPPTVSTVSCALADAQTLPAGLRKAYRRAITTIGRSDSQQQITAMANLTATAYGQHPKPVILEHLNLASLHGWIAYSIYDDFLDGEGLPPELAIANHALRQTTRHYYAALPKHAGFQQLVDRTLDTVDTANRWEVLRARGRLDGTQLYYELPSYGRYDQLAERSWGHMLAASGTLLAIGHSIDSPQLRQLQRFFRHFLIARQLNDDAHDWEVDLQHGHLSAVVCLLLRSYKPNSPVDIQADRSALRQHFWQVTIGQIGSLIDIHTHQARRALAQSGMRNEAVFGGLLVSLEAASEQAVTGSREAQKFVYAYGQSKQPALR
ncbi:MAG TPA: hypothetical protein VK712_01675 [Verrucomicrobiae bacterium]|jgi:hypothetical protein|nr:hypothetical protein [Verrucomicrobiae bacterium]